jgi:hypothetical protein
MNVSELVPLLAQIVDASDLRRSPNQQEMIAVLVAMPEYTRRRHLDEWEAAYPSKREGDDVVAGELLEAIFELGRYNLYTQFNAAETLREYAIISAQLLRAGLSSPQVERIPDW